MQIYAFRAGKLQCLWTDNTDIKDALDWGADAFRYPRGEIIEVVETRLLVPARGTKISHALAHREKQEPNTVFVGMVSHEEYNRLWSEARIGRRARAAEVRQHISTMQQSVSGVVRWEDLTPKMQARFSETNLSPEQCWNWRPLPHLRRDDSAESKAAPYKEFYIKIKGPVPKGVVLRHKCDNRFCMNPNHLEPGDEFDNVRDMMERGRHYRQVLARKRAKKREAYLRRKEKSNRAR
jgi:hypothetical protein